MVALGALLSLSFWGSLLAPVGPKGGSGGGRGPPAPLGPPPAPKLYEPPNPLGITLRGGHGLPPPRLWGGPGGGHSLPAPPRTCWASAPFEGGGMSWGRQGREGRTPARSCPTDTPRRSWQCRAPPDVPAWHRRSLPGPGSWGRLQAAGPPCLSFPTRRGGPGAVLVGPLGAGAGGVGGGHSEVIQTHQHGGKVPRAPWGPSGGRSQDIPVPRPMAGTERGCHLPRPTGGLSPCSSTSRHPLSPTAGYLVLQHPPGQAGLAPLGAAPAAVNEQAGGFAPGRRPPDPVPVPCVLSSPAEGVKPGPGPGPARCHPDTVGCCRNSGLAVLLAGHQYPRVGGTGRGTVARGGPQWGPPARGAPGKGVISISVSAGGGRAETGQLISPSGAGGV